MANNRWFLPTNTANLGMIIAQGLITGPAGSNKYYTDILTTCPGYIVIYKNTVPLIALNKAIEEDDNLVKCLIEINVRHVVKADAFNDSGESFNLPLTGEGRVEALYIKAPLPLSCISKILFENPEDKNTFVQNTETILPNIPLTGLNLQSQVKKEKLFDPGPIDNKVPLNLPLVKTVDYDKVYSLGGLLGVFFYHTKNGEKTKEYFEKFLNPERQDEKKDIDFCSIHNYFFTSNENGSINKVFFSILDYLVKSTDFRNDIISYLRSDDVPEAWGEKTKSIAERLISFHQNTINKPSSEIFQESKSKLKGGKSKMELLLLMLFHREDSESLMELKLNIFNEADYLLFSMLFGIRDKFISLPKTIRKYELLQHFISNEMAKYAHNSTQLNTEFKELKIPVTIIGLLAPNKPEFIQWMSKQLNIQHCFKSVMPNQEFTNNKGISTYLGVTLPKIEIEKDKFFNEMSIKRITDVEYSKFCKKYKGS